jgi:hypothetical protein
MERAIIVGILAVLAGFGSWYMFQTADRVASVPVRSASALADARPGARATAYGRIYVDGQPAMAIYTTSVEKCDTRRRRRSDGSITYERDCNWHETGRQTPPFRLVLNDGAQPTIAIVNGTYQLEGRMRTVELGNSTHQEGFQDGDSVLVIGTVTVSGLNAETVYGGTRDEYIGNTRLLAWGLALAAVGLLIGSIVLVLI